jgi:hypothetical protein
LGIREVLRWLREPIQQGGAPRSSATVEPSPHRSKPSERWTKRRDVFALVALVGGVGFAFSRLYDVSLAEAGLSWLIILFFELLLIGSGLYLVSRGRGRRVGPRVMRYAGYFLILFGLLLIALLPFA